MDRTCPKCQKTFSKPCFLKAHLARKTPCAPIAEPTDLSEADRLKQFPCKYCGRRFTTQISMCRHVRQNCKIANSEEGMDKLLEHTLQRQLAAQRQEMVEMKTRVGRLTTLLEQQLTLTARPPAAPIEYAAQVNNGPVTNNTTNVQNVQNIIHIHPWDGARRIEVSAAQIAAAFAENLRLKEYAGYGDHELTNPELAPPYVTELLMDLVKRGHTDPAARNVYLNPRRADQVLVHMKSGKWEVMQLAEATRALFDGVAEAIHKVALSYAEAKALPLEAQNALAMAGMLYDEEPEAYVERARGRMTAHLANCRDAAPGAVQPS